MPRSNHILVVDDYEEIRELLSDLLTTLGYRVTSAMDGLSMRAALAGEDPIDLVILDAMMPGEASTSLALHAKQLKLRVIMMSGSPDAMEFATMHKLQLLRKPFKLRDVQAALESAFDNPLFGQRHS